LLSISCRRSWSLQSARANYKIAIRRRDRSMCYIWTYLDYRSLCYIWTYLDYKKELVLHLDVQYLDYRSPCYSTAQIIYIKLNSYPNWDHPTPSPTGECVPSSFGSGRVGEHNRLQEREWGIPIRTRRHTLWYSRCFVPHRFCSELNYTITRVQEYLSLRPNCLPPLGLLQASVCPPPNGEQLNLEGEGAGGANSDDWRESLALCILCGPVPP
jgi:hypothetical protein